VGLVSLAREVDSALLQKAVETGGDGPGVGGERLAIWLSHSLDERGRNRVAVERGGEGLDDLGQAAAGETGAREVASKTFGREGNGGGARGLRGDPHGGRGTWNPGLAGDAEALGAVGGVDGGEDLDRGEAGVESP